MPPSPNHRGLLPLLLVAWSSAHAAELVILAPTPWQVAQRGSAVCIELSGSGLLAAGPRTEYRLLMANMGPEPPAQLPAAASAWKPLTLEPHDPAVPDRAQATVELPAAGWYRAYGLARHVKMNLETNHATLAGHEIQHELEYAGMQGFLASADANTGDTLVGLQPSLAEAGAAAASQDRASAAQNGNPVRHESCCSNSLTPTVARRKRAKKGCRGAEHDRLLGLREGHARTA